MKNNNEKKAPKWINRLFDRIHKHWNYHAPCSHINMQAFWDDEYKAWQVKAAPVFQEVLGGPDDGKRVWAGFLFEMGEFSRTPGVWVQEQAVASFCNECTPYPKLMVKGKFEGHPFFLHIFLEPIAETDTVEIIDTLKQEIREKQPTPQESE